MEDSTQTRVIGVLLGKQEGKVMEIVNTVELAFKLEKQADGKFLVKIDEDFAKKRLDAYKQMFGDLQCIGWYSGRIPGGQDEPEAEDIVPHKSLSKFSENPLLMIMNPESAEALEKKQLPLFLYELHSVHEEKRFVKINFSLATADSERVAVDHIYKSVDQGSKESIMA